MISALREQFAAYQALRSLGHFGMVIFVSAGHQ
jgi:hypothetical protein